jgi:hypothetical protein
MVTEFRNSPPHDGTSPLGLEEYFLEPPKSLRQPPSAGAGGPRSVERERSKAASYSVARIALNVGLGRSAADAF